MEELSVKSVLYLYLGATSWLGFLQNTDLKFGFAGLPRRFFWFFFSGKASPE